MASGCTDPGWVFGAHLRYELNKHKNIKLRRKTTGFSYYSGFTSELKKVPWNISSLLCWPQGSSRTISNWDGDEGNYFLRSETLCFLTRSQHPPLLYPQFLTVSLTILLYDTFNFFLLVQHFQLHCVPAVCMLVAQMAEANRQLLSYCCSLSPCAPQLPISNKYINSVFKTSTVFSDVFEISQWIRKLTGEKRDYVNFVSIGNPAWRKVVLWGELRKPGFLGTCLPRPTMVPPVCLLQHEASCSLPPPGTAPRCHLCPHQPCLHGCCRLCQMSLFNEWPASSGERLTEKLSCPWLLEDPVLCLASWFCKACGCIHLWQIWLKHG